MKERISRIVKGQVGNPSVNRVWTTLVVALALSATVGIALAQERPRRLDSDRDRIEREAGAREATLKGRRNVLHRLLEQLNGQARETEAAIDHADNEERRQILGAELQTLRQQIEHLQGQVSQLERRDRDRPEEENRLREHMEELAMRAERLERDWSRLGDERPEQAREVEHALESTQDEMRSVEQRLERRRQENPERREHVEDARQELRERRERVQAQRRELESVLDARRESDGPFRPRELEARFDELVEEEHNLDALEQDMEHNVEHEVVLHGGEEEMQQRREHQMQLQKRMQEMEETLHGLQQKGQGEGEEAREIRRTLESTARELRGLDMRHEEEMHAVDFSHDPAAPLVTRVLKLKYANPMHLAELLQPLIAHPRGRVMADLRSRSLIISDAPDNAEQQMHIIRELDVPGETSNEFEAVNDAFPVQGRESDEDTREAKREVDALRDQVGELNHQLQQMRVMLEQLAKDRSGDDATDAAR